MSKHLVFLVHGMGEFADGWADDTKNQLARLYGKYDSVPGLPPFDDLKLVEITYNHLFEALRDQWRTNSQAVLDKLSDGGLEGGALNQLTELGAAPAQEGFLATHVLDVFLYRFVGQVAEQVRTHVATKLLEEINALPVTEIRRWSIISHSLGTAVSHDSLHALFTAPGAVGQQRPPRANLVAMVSNVSRLLQNDIDAYLSEAHPSADPDKGVCAYYLNAKHDWDPFVRPKEFRPLDDWPDPLTRAQNRYVPITINAFAEKNIHSLSHYLENPKVHIPLFRRLTRSGDILLTDEVLATASAVYEMSTPFGQFEKLQDQLKDLQLADSATWHQTLRAFRKFFDALAKAA